ncbi:cytochrome P450 20A1-like [Aplysia californica]|uniref:Cytochrome P450 20A1-like n=1 Tax=Aplysia californica TaxID=6500 RepID=A0ABM1VWU6_APLCA|nr:cytochrome P450 20A1-like [Aplysia californica]
MERQLTDSVPPDKNDTRQKSFQEALQYLHTMVKKVVEQRQQNKVQDQQLLIDVILQSTTDEDVLTSDVISYMVGAFHTTAYLLTWAMYFLATHPDVQNKLHSEIVQVLGQKDVITDSNYGQLRYPFIITPVIHAFGVVLQDEKLWPLPQKFDPGRFSAEHSKSQRTYAFSPFGFAGKRICPAYKFAYNESTVLIATLIRKFEVSMWGDQVVKPVFGFVTRPQEEIWLKVSRRK